MKFPSIAPSITLFTLLLAPTLSLAADCRPGNILFSCTTKASKQILLCEVGSTIKYVFGPRGRTPDLVLRVPKAAASMTPWNGFGALFHSIEVPNADTVYSVYWSGLRDPNHPSPFSGGVRVNIGGREAANVECDPRRPIINNMEELELRVTQ